MISRSTGLFRDMAMAFSFGTHESVAALFVAYRMAHLLRRLLGEGAMQSAFIPHFEALRAASPARAGRFFGNLYAALTLVLLGIIFFSGLAIGAFLSISNISEANREILTLTMILLPSLLFICLYGLNASLLQCEKEYWIPSLAPIGFNLFWTVGALLLYQTPEVRAMPWLAGFIVCGCMAQWMITIPKTLEFLKKSGIHQPWKGIELRSFELRGFVKPLALGILGVAAAQINNALDAIFARYAETDGPALLWYSIRIQQLPLALFGIALSGALLPPLSRAHEAQDIPKFRSFLEFALQRTLFLIVPVMFVLWLMGDAGINLVYGRGGFTLDSVIGTTWCLWGYAIGIIPMALVLILAPSFYAQKNYRITTIASVLSVLLNIALNTYFVMFLGYSSASVAVATGISAWLNYLILVKQLKVIPGMFIWKAMAQTALFAVAGSIGVIAVDEFFFGGSSALQIWNGETPVYAASFFERGGNFAAQAGAFTAIYGLLGYAFIWRK